LKIVIIFVIVVIRGVLLGSLGEVDDPSTGSATRVDDVVGVNLVEVILLLFFCMGFIVRIRLLNEGRESACHGASPR